MSQNPKSVLLSYLLLLPHRVTHPYEARSQRAQHHAQHALDVPCSYVQSYQFTHSKRAHGLSTGFVHAVYIIIRKAMTFSLASHSHVHVQVSFLKSDCLYNGIAILRSFCRFAATSNPYTPVVLASTVWRFSASSPCGTVLIICRVAKS